jgi:hypothetical protein
MKYRYSLTIISLLLCTGFTQAQDIMSILKPTSKSYQQLAVFDVTPANISLEKIESSVLSALQVYASQTRAERKLMPNILPVTPGVMTFEEIKLPFGLSAQIPKCNDAVDIIKSEDTDLAQYGNVTQAMACIFVYKDGYRVHYYAKFSEQSGGTVAQIGGAIGSMFLRAVGFGDSSQFIGATITNIQERLVSTGATVKLVEMKPAMEGKIVERDNLADQARASQQQQQAHIIAIGARKELTSIGLNPNSYEDFISAVKRGDKLAVKLFVQADSVDLNQEDKDGKRPIHIARRKDIVDLLTEAGAI